MQVPNTLNTTEGVDNNFFSFVPNIESAAEVPVVQAEDLDERTFMKDWVENNRPCLIKGAVKHWPAVSKWKNKDYWQTECDNFEVPVFMHSNFLNDNEHNQGKDDMLFHDAIERLYQNKDHILSMPSEVITKDNGLANTLQDIGRFNFLDPNLKPRVYWGNRVFIYRRAATSWHSHPYDETLMCQVNGNKRVALFYAPKNFEKDISRFIRAEEYLKGKVLDKSISIQPFVAMVEEGDALYIPPYWYHGVAPTDGNIGFTLAHCWASPLHKLGDFSNFIVRNNYKRALWPIRRSTLKVPFLGIIAGCSFLIRQIKVSLTAR